MRRAEPEPSREPRAKIPALASASGVGGSASGGRPRPSAGEDKFLLTPAPRLAADHNDDAPELLVLLSRVYKFERIEVLEVEVAAAADGDDGYGGSIRRRLLLRGRKGNEGEEHVGCESRGSTLTGRHSSRHEHSWHPRGLKPGQMGCWGLFKRFQKFTGVF